MAAGTKADLLSPLISIGATNYGGPSINGTTTNSTTDIFLSASNGENIYESALTVHSYPVNATAFNVTSDDRLKHNEEDITDSLSIIRKLKPQKYQKTKEMKEADFNGTLTEGEYTVEAGFIAQDVQKVPELNFCVKDPISEDKDVYHLDYNSIFTHNVAATKELDALVTELRAETASLKERVAALERSEFEILKSLKSK